MAARDGMFVVVERKKHRGAHRTRYGPQLHTEIIMNERGATGWTDEPNASYRSYLYHAVEDEGAHYAAVLHAGVDVSAKVSDTPPSWTFEVRRPNGFLLCAGLIKSGGEPGRELARAMCDAALGHEPQKGYRVSRREAGGWTHTVVLARSGVEAKRLWLASPATSTSRENPMDREMLHNAILWALGDLNVEASLNDIRERLERLAPDEWLEAREGETIDSPNIKCSRIDGDKELEPGGQWDDHIAVGPWVPYAAVHTPEDQDGLLPVKYYRRPLRKKP